MKNYLNLRDVHLKDKDGKRRMKKWKRQRISRGFCDYDWWDLDAFLANLICNSLRHYANNTIGWSEAIASSPEEYKERILALADAFEEMVMWEENHLNSRNYEEDWARLHDLTKEAFNELGEVFWTLWD